MLVPLCCSSAFWLMAALHSEVIRRLCDVLLTSKRGHHFRYPTAADPGRRFNERHHCQLWRADEGLVAAPLQIDFFQQTGGYHPYIATEGAKIWACLHVYLSSCDDTRKKEYQDKVENFLAGLSDDLPPERREVLRSNYISRCAKPRARTTQHLILFPTARTPNLFRGTTSPARVCSSGSNGRRA